MSNSVRPHGRQPTRLPSPWDSPGKNTGVGCHFLLQCMKVKSQSEAAQSCPTRSNPMDYSLPGSSIHGIFQARVLEWVAIAFSLWYLNKHLFKNSNHNCLLTLCSFPYGYQGEGCRQGIVRELVMDMYTHLYLKWITNRTCSTAQGTLLRALWQPRWKGLSGEWICLAMHLKLL